MIVRENISGIYFLFKKVRLIKKLWIRTTWGIKVWENRNRQCCINNYIINIVKENDIAFLTSY